MIVVPGTYPYRTHAMRALTGVHLPKVVSETEQTKCAIECLKKQQKSK